MKGQYLAVETMLTVGIGVIVAAGSIGLFEAFQQERTSSGERAQAAAIRSELLNGAQSLNAAQSGRITLELPEDISGERYEVVLSDEEVDISTDDSSYRYRAAYPNLSKSGSSTGGRVSLIKREDQLFLRQK